MQPDSGNSNAPEGAENDETENSLQNLEFKILSAFAKIPTFLQARRESLVEGHREEINDLLRTEWERSESYTIKVDYNSSISVDDSFEMQIYKQSCSNQERPAVWCRIFGITEERNAVAYEALKQQWRDWEGSKQFPNWFQEHVSLIEKDVVRVEQNNPAYRVSNSGEKLSGFDSGNKNINSIRNILVTFLAYQEEPNDHGISSIIHGLGYSQGMTDICWAFFNLFNNEADAFWGFVGFMERHGEYFGKDSESIKFDLICLRKMVELFYPNFYSFLQECRALNMFFCYRWLVLFFKREFTSIDEVYRIWEVLFTNPYSQKYQVFILLAIMHIYHDELLIYASEEGHEMEIITNFFSSKHFKLDQILEQSEVLFKRYAMLESLVLDKDLKKLRQYRK